MAENKTAEPWTTQSSMPNWSQEAADREILAKTRADVEDRHQRALTRQFMVGAFAGGLGAVALTHAVMCFLQQTPPSLWIGLVCCPLSLVLFLRATLNAKG